MGLPGGSGLAWPLGEGGYAAMMIWINGAFGAGKTTLAEELHKRMPEALPFGPEYVGLILRHTDGFPVGPKD